MVGVAKIAKRMILMVPLFVWVGCSDSQPPPAISADLLIRSGYLIDMVSNEPQVKALRGLAIKGGKIHRIIPSDTDEALPKASQVIEGESLYILPGLIDAHVHFRPWYPEIFLHYGVTSLVDTGPCGADCQEDPNQWILNFQKSIEAGSRKGPTLYITGIKLDGPNGSTDAHVYRLQSVDEIPAKIEFLAGLGASAIKAEEYLPVEFRRRIIEEAGLRGLPVVGHSRDAVESIQVGMRFIEHTYPIARSIATDPELAHKLGRSSEHLMEMSRVPEIMGLMLENRVYLNPTLLGRFRSLSAKREQYAKEERELLRGALFETFPEEFRSVVADSYLSAEAMEPLERKKFQLGYENVKEFIREFSQKGGLLLAASDATQRTTPGLATHREIELLVEAGVTPYAALLGATRYPAELLRKEGQIGTIQEGMDADLLIVGSNPLENVAATQDIEYVVKEGTIERSR